MNLYTYIIGTTAPDPDDEVYVSVNAIGDSVARLAAQAEVRALGLTPVVVNLSSVYYDTPEGEPVVTRKTP